MLNSNEMTTTSDTSSLNIKKKFLSKYTSQQFPIRRRSAVRVEIPFRVSRKLLLAFKR